MSDMLFYTARIGHMFRVHGQIPLNDLFVEERTDNPTQYSFSIYSNNSNEGNDCENYSRRRLRIFLY